MAKNDCLLKVMASSKNKAEYEMVLSSKDLTKIEAEFETASKLSPQERNEFLKDVMDGVEMQANSNFTRKVQSFNAQKTFKAQFANRPKGQTARQFANRYLERIYSNMQAEASNLTGRLELSLDELGKPNMQILLGGELDEEIMAHVASKADAPIPKGLKISAKAKEIGDKVHDFLNLTRKEQTDAGAVIDEVFGFVGAQNHRTQDYKKSFPDLKSFREFADSHYNKEKMLEISDEKDWDKFLEGLYVRMKSGDHAKEDVRAINDFSYVHSNKSVAKSLSMHRKIIYKDGQKAFAAMKKLHHSKSLAETLNVTATKAARTKTLLTLQGDDYQAFSEMIESLVSAERHAGILKGETKVVKEDMGFLGMKKLFREGSGGELKDKISQFAGNTPKRIEILNGVYDGSADELPTALKFLQFVIDIQPFLKLGGAVIMSPGDQVLTRNMMIGRGMNRSSGAYMDTLNRQFPALAKGLWQGADIQDMAKMSHRIAYNKLRVHTRYDMEGMIPSKFAEKANDAIMVGTLMNRLDRSTKLMITGILDQSMGDFSNRTFAQLDATPNGQKFARYLNDAGFSAAGWDVMRNAGIRGDEFSTFAIEGIDDVTMAQMAPLFKERNWKATPNNLSQLKRELKTNIVDFYLDSRRNGIPEPSLATRATFTWGAADSLPGLMGRAVGQFKGFPLELVRQLVRNSVLPQNQMGAIGLTAMTMAELTILGYMTFSAKEAIKGNTPPDFTDPKVILESVARGGAFGPFADLLLRDYSRYGTSVTDTLFGPSVGDFDAYAKFAFKVTEAAFTGDHDKALEEFKKIGFRLAPNPWQATLLMTVTEQMVLDQYGTFWSESQRKSRDRITEERGQEKLFMP